MPWDDPAELTPHARQRGFRKTDYRTTCDVLAVLSFMLTGGILLRLEHWAGR